MTFSAGLILKLSVFGSSHGKLVGGTLDGLPSGTLVEPDEIRKWLDFRRPSGSIYTSQRKEADDFEIVSGVSGDHTDGGPVTMTIRNLDAMPSHYAQHREYPRPGHADITQFYKYGEFRSQSGGGFFSGRMTAPIVGLASIPLRVLERSGVSVASYIDSMDGIAIDQNILFGPYDAYSFPSRIPDKGADSRAQNLLKKVMGEGDSLGATITTVIMGLKPGLGEPFFDSVESHLARFLFSIPGVKGLEFGTGFGFPSRRGSEVKDEFYYEEGRILTRNNNNGGILGGITNGMPVVFRIAMKPTSSIRVSQKSVSIVSGEAHDIRVEGRHDPCIAIRAVPVVQTLSSMAILDLMMSAREPEFRIKFR
jgi:chorismate synthase